jgi:Domain of Unknown Function with PDB structure (DUF3857)/Transglutaminase-like superfamily
MRQARFLMKRVQIILGLLALIPLSALAATAPEWMHAQAVIPLPAHDEKSVAVLMYSESQLTVQPDGKMTRMDRRVYRILRPDGGAYGIPMVVFDKSRSRVIAMRGWCIPAAGKDYEITDRDALEAGMTSVQNGLLATDLRLKMMKIPEAVPGSIVGYEIEQQLWPEQLADVWAYQDQVPVREAHFILSLPAGWSFQATWLNHADQAAIPAGENHWHWVVSDVDAVRLQPRMPPWKGLAAQLWIAPIPPNAASSSLASWHDVGAWYQKLTLGQRASSPQLAQKVAELTASEPSQLGKMRALAEYVQKDTRYVAVELGIGGYLPHSAATTLANHFGDCKDKATLLSAMLKLIGIESDYVLINTERGAVNAGTPPNLGFNHAILAIQLPAGLEDPTLVAQLHHPTLGQLLYFDPTDDLTPFGSLRGALQANYGLLVGPDGGELLALPQLAVAANGLKRTGQLTLDATGMLRGDIQETRIGDLAAQTRQELRTSAQSADRIKPIEAMLANSLANVEILKATIGNAQHDDQPFVWNYSLEAEGYAKRAGNLLMVRPWVLGSDSRNFLNTDEARVEPVELERPERTTDLFEITLPEGYIAESLPAPINLDYGFASYHSKSELVGQTLRYTRDLEIRQLDIPLEKTEQLKKFFDLIFDDERSLAVLKKSGI